MSRRRVAVTGLGTINPLGHDVASTWTAIMEGRSGVARITRFDPDRLATQIAGEVKGFDAAEYFGSREAKLLDRFAQFSRVAADQAMADAGIAFEEGDPAASRAGVVLGVGIGGMDSFIEGLDVLRERGPGRINPYTIPKLISNMGAGVVSMAHNLLGPSMCTVTACAASANAIGDAAEIIRRGAADVMVAVGSEAAVNEFAMGSFNQSRALSTRNDEPERASRPFDSDRDGFILAEGAAALVLEDYEAAGERGATIYGEILGYGMSSDGYHMTLPRPGGTGAAAAMTAALRDADLPPEAIGYINAHGTSTAANDATETAAIKLAFGDHAYDLAVSSTKSMTGHLLGGAGAAEAVLTLLAMRNGILPPTINLETPDPECDLDYVPNQPRKADVSVSMSNSFGFGGHNVALVLGR
ncbi:MAG: beta-ketoacyl-ACP synthase II [Acidimicrobiia bacterium]|nr:beta-ketoacyl-ACP synthase II [Acidimicrobiia bacterium]